MWPSFSESKTKQDHEAWSVRYRGPGTVQLCPCSGGVVEECMIWVGIQYWTDGGDTRMNEGRSLLLSSLHMVSTRPLHLLSYYWTWVLEERVAGPKQIDPHVWENTEGPSCY